MSIIKTHRNVLVRDLMSAMLDLEQDVRRWHNVVLESGLEFVAARQDIHVSPLLGNVSQFVSDYIKNCGFTGTFNRIVTQDNIVSIIFSTVALTEEQAEETYDFIEIMEVYDGDDDEADDLDDLDDLIPTLTPVAEKVIALVEGISDAPEPETDEPEFEAEPAFETVDEPETALEFETADEPEFEAAPAFETAAPESEVETTVEVIDQSGAVEFEPELQPEAEAEDSQELDHPEQVVESDAVESTGADVAPVPELEFDATEVNKDDNVDQRIVELNGELQKASYDSIIVDGAVLLTHAGQDMVVRGSTRVVLSKDVFVYEVFREGVGINTFLTTQALVRFLETLSS